MCGIAGYIGKKTISKKIINNALISMENRGPDNKSYKKLDENIDNLGEKLESILKDYKDLEQYFKKVSKENQTLKNNDKASNKVVLDIVTNTSKLIE